MGKWPERAINRAKWAVKIVINQKKKKNWFEIHNATWATYKPILL